MWLTSTLAYWSSLGLLSYTYIGYPLAVNAVAHLRPRPVRPGPIEPRVSVVMSVKNEKQRIAQKLENLLSLDYPPNRLDVIVVSDGSTDGTDEVVRGFDSERVRLERLETGGGKAAALNLGVQLARGEIVLFCDVRQRLEPSVLTAIIPLFGDPSVGAVSGELMMSETRGPGLYWTYEKWIRAAEGQVNSVVGATGALYAIRRHLFRPLPEGCLLDDVFTPMQVVLQGYRVLFQPEARCHDQEATLKGEFARKARTLAGNFQIIQLLPDILNPIKNQIFLQYVSHKVLRLLCPVALGTLLASNLVLVATFAPGWPFYLFTLGGQLALYGLAASPIRWPGIVGQAASFSRTFVVLNAAAVEGFVRFLRGDFGWTSMNEPEAGNGTRRPRSEPV